MNEYLEKSNKNKYLTLVPTNENKEITEKYEELCCKIGDLIRSVIKNSEDLDDDSDEPLKKR